MSTSYQPHYNYTVAGANGASGSTLTYTGTSANWVQPNLNFQNGNGKKLMSIPQGDDKVILEKDATLDVRGNVVINGVDLEERLSTIETLLQIPTRDVTMEQKHPKLAELYKQYMHELEKYRTWDRIKGEDDGTT
jgi:hypothetical protein